MLNINRRDIDDDEENYYNKFLIANNEVKILLPLITSKDRNAQKWSRKTSTTKLRKPQEAEKSTGTSIIKTRSYDQKT